MRVSYTVSIREGGGVPTVSMFYGIVIRMYVSEHNPPHFHAHYQGFRAIFDFEGNLLEGEMPNKQQHLIRAWALLHSDELDANWELASHDEQPYRIEPLR